MRPAQSQRFPRFFLGLAVCVLTSVAAHADGVKPKPAAERAKLTAGGETLSSRTHEVQPGLAGSFLSSRFAREHQDLQEAAKYLGETLVRDPNNEALKHEVLRAQLLAGNIDEAVAIARTLDATSDPVVVCALLIDRMNAGDIPGARELVGKAPSAGLFGLVRPLMTQWLMIANGDTKGEVNLQPVIDKSGFFAPFIRYQEALMQDVLGNVAGARTAYAKAAADPAVTPYRVVQAIANFKAREGKWDEAQAAFDAYAKSNPDSSLIPEPLVPTDPASVTPLVANAKQGLAELFFTTASIIFGQDATQDTFVYLRVALSLRPDFPPAQLMLANLYEQVGDYDAAILAYDGIDPKSVFYRRGQVRKALNYEALGQKEKALAVLDEYARAHPKDASAYITRGDMLREAERYAEAAESYGQAITRSEPLGPNDWPLFYARGISYERSGKWDMAEADFTRALNLSPNQPDVLNYLGYSWLTMNKNLDKARQYIDLALNARPEDAHILDSAGWARYLAGDFKGAAQLLEKAVDRMPDDVTVNDHLGDAYWRVGREVEARFQWERALNFKPEAELVEVIRGKLNRGLAPFMPAQGTVASSPEAPAKTDLVGVPETPTVQ